MWEGQLSPQEEAAGQGRDGDTQPGEGGGVSTLGFCVNSEPREPSITVALGLSLEAWGAFPEMGHRGTDVHVCLA